MNILGKKLNMSPKNLKSYNLQASRGFTMVELLLYVATLSVVIVLSMQFVVSIIEASAKSVAKEEVQDNSSAILQAFDFLVRHSQAVYDPTSDFTGDPGQLSLVTSRGLPPDETIGYIDIYIDDGRFCVKYEFSRPACISSSKVELTSLTFNEITQPGGAESVQMNFTIRYKGPTSDYDFSESVQTSARVRPY